MKKQGFHKKYPKRNKNSTYKLKSNITFLLIFLSLIGFQYLEAQEKKTKTSDIKQDTTSIATIKKDSIKKDSVKKPKEIIESVIVHNAKDYTIQNAKNKTVELYNQANVTYKDIDLKAGIILIDYNKNLVFAKGIKDSTKYKQRPIFKQGGQESEQDSIVFNFKTKRAIVYGVKTVQDGIITYGDKTKRVNDSTVFMRELRFTTSKKKNPDFYIGTNKAKLVPGKKIIVGVSNLIIADVPTPLYLPFAYFPLTKGRTSGFIMPTWGEVQSRGFFLNGGGYYFVISDFFDLKAVTDIYTNGSWGINLSSNYYKRYKFSGNFSFSYDDRKTGIKGLSNYSESSEYRILWSYSEDSKSSPNSSFSANVNFGSTLFDRNNLSDYNLRNSISNSFGSSINYRNNLNGIPFDFNANINHNQNVNTHDVNISTSVSSNMDAMNPFEGKGGVRKNALQKITVNYGLNANYNINTKDSLLFTPKMYKTARKGITHTASASTNMKLFKYFTLSPSARYSDYWFFERIKKEYDPDYVSKDGVFGIVKTDTISRFSRYNHYSFSMGLNTILYGTFNFKKGRIKTIRHTLTPSVSFGYTPSFEHLYKRVQKNSKGEIEDYFPYPEGSASKKMSSSVSFSLNNVIEAKVEPDEDDKSDEDKKVTFIRNLSLNTSYDISRDSVRWSPLSVSLSVPLFKDKFSLDPRASFSFYKFDKNGSEIEEFNDNLLRLTYFGIGTSFTLSSKDFEKEKDSKKEEDSNKTNNNVFDKKNENLNNFAHTTQDGTTEKKEVKAKLYKHKMPWNLTVNYDFSFSNPTGTPSRNNSLTFSGDIELSPKWKVGITSGYDLENWGFTPTQLRFARDLDSWHFNFSWTPFGENSSYFFFIGVKSSVLSALKWDKNKPPDKFLY